MATSKIVIVTNEIPDMIPLYRKMAATLLTKVALDGVTFINTEFRSKHSGKVYGRGIKKKGRGKGKKIEHQASAEGEPPAIDTGALAASIEPYIDGAEELLVTTVNAGTEYAELLEYGSPGGTLAPRPFMQPMNDRAEKQIDRILGQLVQQVLKG